MFEQVLSIDRMENAVSLFGSFDENIRLIESEFSVTVLNRGSDLKISGEAENVAKATTAIERLLALINKGEALSDQNVRYVISLVKDGEEDKLMSLSGDCVCITSKGKPVKPKTLGQKKYVEAIRKNTIVLGAGPAGTGKTYLAVAMNYCYFPPLFIGVGNFRHSFRICIKGRSGLVFLREINCFILTDRPYVLYISISFSSQYMDTMCLSSISRPFCQ